MRADFQLTICRVQGRLRGWHGPPHGGFSADKSKTITGRLWGYVRDDRPFDGNDPPSIKRALRFEPAGPILEAGCFAHGGHHGGALYGFELWRLRGALDLRRQPGVRSGEPRAGRSWWRREREAAFGMGKLNASRELGGLSPALTGRSLTDPATVRAVRDDAATTAIHNFAAKNALRALGAGYFGQGQAGESAFAAFTQRMIQ